MQTTRLAPCTVPYWSGLHGARAQPGRRARHATAETTHAWAQGTRGLAPPRMLTERASTAISVIEFAVCDYTKHQNRVGTVSHR
jgi:hypothetical protein